MRHLQSGLDPGIGFGSQGADSYVNLIAELDDTGNRDFVTRQVEVAAESYLDLLTSPYAMFDSMPDGYLA